MYKRLQHARVERSGITSSRLNFETDRCTYQVSSDGIRFNFNIASKGGWGYTDVLLTIGIDDLSSILGDVADNVGGATWLLLSAALNAASEQSVELRHVCSNLAEAMESASAAISEASNAPLNHVEDQTPKGVSTRSSPADTDGI